MNQGQRAGTLTAGRVAGALYVVASAGFLVVFAWLSSHFGYPDVLEEPAAIVLPRLAQLGQEGLLVWAVYALLPLLLLPAAAAAAVALRRADGQDDGAMQLVVLLQLVAAVAMMLGLARWSTAQWMLAQRWGAADAIQREAIATLFDVLNLFLGNAIGEFVGELMLYGSFLALAAVLWRRGARLLAGFAGVTTVVGWCGMFRNMTPAVQLAADTANVLLPAFLITLGLCLFAHRTGANVRRSSAAVGVGQLV